VRRIGAPPAAIRATQVFDRGDACRSRLRNHPSKPASKVCDLTKSLEGRLPADDRRDARYDALPDVRDGLTREERVVLYVLQQTQIERCGRNVPTAMLWGRVCEHFYISPQDLSDMLARLGARN
jgi:hypothetical protein